MVEHQRQDPPPCLHHHRLTVADWGTLELVPLRGLPQCLCMPTTLLQHARRRRPLLLLLSSPRLH